jgi:hypothetical protein
MNYRPTITKPPAAHPWRRCTFMGRAKKHAVYAHGQRQRDRRKAEMVGR